MTFDPDKLTCLSSPINNEAGNLWLYREAEVDSNINATDYFTNGQKYGMKAGDAMIFMDTTTPKSSLHYVSAVDADGNVTTAFGAVA